MVRADNDIDLEFDANNVVGDAPLPDVIADGIASFAKIIVDRQDWEVYAGRDCESFVPKAFRIAISPDRDLYVVMFREAYDDSLGLLIHDKIRNVRSAHFEVSYRPMNVPGVIMRRPYIAFADLRGDGGKQNVIQQPAYVVTFSYSVEYHFYEIGPQMQFMHVFAYETRMSNYEDGWETTFVREVTQPSKVRVKVTTKVGPKDSKRPLKEVGDVIFESRGKGDPFWIVQRHVKNRQFDNKLVTIGAHSREDENNFVAGR